MKAFVVSGWVAVLSCTAILDAPCVPGNLQSFIDLGATGCEVETVQFTSFTIVPGEPTATPVDPAQVQVTPGGTAFNPMFLFTLDTTANAGEVFTQDIWWSTRQACFPVAASTA